RGASRQPAARVPSRRHALPGGLPRGAHPGRQVPARAPPVQPGAQGAVIDRSRVDRKLGDYGVAPASALADQSLLAQVQEAGGLARARTRAVARDEMAATLPGAEYHVSRKYDGEYTVLVWRDGEAFTINEGGMVRVGLPFLAEAAKLLAAARLDRAMIVGETYVVMEGRPGRYYDGMPVLRNPASQAEIAR